MPTDTFFGLSEEKRHKIINAGKREFSKKTFDMTSIKNIAEDAGISRGSFYQYFESKEDLLEYIIKEQKIAKQNEFDSIIKKANGDIFKVCIALYDEMSTEKLIDENNNEFPKIFHNVMQSKEKRILEKSTFAVERVYEVIEKENLNAETEEEIFIIIKMLLDMTFKSVLDSKFEEDKEKTREIFIRKLEFLKNGVVKN